MYLSISKWGNSFAVRLPKEIVIQLNLKDNDTLDYEISGNKIILEKKDAIPELTVQELFKDYKGEPINTTPTIFKTTGNEQW